MKKTIKQTKKITFDFRSVVPISSCERKTPGTAPARSEKQYYVTLKLCDLVRVCLTLSPYTDEHN